MRRSVRWTLFASVMTALALFVAACGGSDNNSSTSGGGSVDHAARHTVKAGKQGGTLTYLAAGDVDYLDPGQDYYTFGYMVQYADQPRRCTRSSPTTPSSRCRTSPRARPQISSDNKTITVNIKPGVKYAPAGQPRGQDRGHQVRHRARVLQAGPQRLRGRLLQLDRRHAGEGQHAATSSRSRASRRPTTPRSSSSSRRRARRCVSQALVMPITVPVPEEYAKKFDAKHPVDVRPVRRLHRPVHGQERPQTGKLTGRVPGKSIDIVRNPNWDKSTDYRPAYLDAIKIEEGNDDLADGLAPRAERLGTRSAATPARRRRRCSSRRCSSSKDQVLVRAVRRHALHRAQHHGQAVRQHQRPQGDHRRLPTATPCA